MGQDVLMIAARAAGPVIMWVIIVPALVWALNKIWPDGPVKRFLFKKR